jgi:hypothetical protein
MDTYRLLKLCFFASLEEKWGENFEKNEGASEKKLGEESFRDSFFFVIQNPSNLEEFKNCIGGGLGKIFLGFIWILQL